MYIIAYLALCCATALCLPAVSEYEREGVNERQSPLRLIKTSEDDPGQWVTEEQKITEFRAKKINFIDVTDAPDPNWFNRKGLGNNESLRIAQTIVYPPLLSHQDQVTTLLARANVDGPKKWLKGLTSFYNRYYRSPEGTQASQWLLNLLTDISRPNPGITVTPFKHSYNQPSLIVRVPGQAPDLVVLGAHFDSTGGRPDARGPGAVDNASGVVVLLETLRLLAQTGARPTHTIEFHFYSGEEGGLLGSEDIWRSYSAQQKAVVAFVNTDMAGYSPSKKISVYDDYADQALTGFVRLIVGGYVGSSTRDTCGYGCSDHASAFAYGFPAAYVCDEPDRTSSPYVHSEKDAYDTVDFDTVMRHIKFTLAFVVESDSIPLRLQPAVASTR